MKFFIEVTRTSYARLSIEIDASCVRRARELAMERAPEKDFSTYETEYEVTSVNVKQD